MVKMFIFLLLSPTSLVTLFFLHREGRQISSELTLYFPKIYKYTIVYYCFSQSSVRVT